MLDYYNFKNINDLFARGSYNEARHILMEMQAKYIALGAENTELRMQLNEYKDIFHLARHLVFDGLCYWLNTNGIKQGPFCEHCYNAEGVLVRLENVYGQMTCPKCGAMQDKEQPGPLSAPPRPVGKTARVTPLFEDNRVAL